MREFKKNRVCYDYETVGEQLFLARQKQNLSLKKAAKKTNIDQKYLHALENGNYKELPGGVYRKNFLKKYSRFLELDTEKIKTSFFKEKEILEPDQNKTKTPKVRRVKTCNFLIFPRIIKNILLVSLILACFLYLGFYLNKTISQPKLVIQNPASDTLSVSDKTIKINGSTHPEARVFINNKSILKDNQGNFSETINLKKGLNVITISAKKKYSQLNVVKKQILVH